MKLRSVALIGVVSFAALGLVGAGAHAVFTTSTTSSQRITVASNFGAPPTVTISYPVNNTTYGTNLTNAITGTAASNSGAGTSITKVKVSVQQVGGSGFCWTGSGNNYTDPCPNYVAVTSGTTSWSLDVSQV